MNNQLLMGIGPSFFGSVASTVSAPPAPPAPPLPPNNIPEFLLITLAGDSITTLVGDYLIPFIYFDATQYQNKPAGGDPGALGFDAPLPRMKLLPVLYEGTLYPNGPTNPYSQTRINSFGAYPGIYTFDVEVSPNNTPANYAVLTQASRLAGPAQLGFYGVPGYTGITGYTWNPALLNPNSSETAAWHAANDAFASALQNCEALFPSLYSYPTDPAVWRQHALIVINECHRVAPGKPVYVFIWPESPLSGHEGEYVGDAYWKTMVDTLLVNASGIVIWAGYHYDVQNSVWVREQWDSSNTWYPRLN
jgi:hypothetical protein